MKTSIEIEPIEFHKGSLVIFDRTLGARSISQIKEIFTRVKNEALDV